MDVREPESDGEIEDDDGVYDSISSQEEDFFQKIQNEIKKTESRKAELELENSFANYEQRKENMVSINLISDKWRTRKTLQKSPVKRLRRDSYKTSNSLLRAPSVFNCRPVKRKKPSRKEYRMIKKRARLQQLLPNKFRNNNSDKIIEIDNDEEIDDNGEESNDDELLELRLMALKTKPEVRDLIVNNNENEKIESKEEEELRIQALKSAVFKNKDEIRMKMLKKRQKDEQRPYSPSDQIEEDMMILSPLGSPIVIDEVNNQEIDMDISNSPEIAEKESSDMDIAESPQSLDDDISSHIVDEDEIALRAQLLTSLAKKKQEEKVQLKKKEEEKKQITENLKLAVQRIKQKKQPLVAEITTSSSLNLSSHINNNINDNRKLASALERIRCRLVQSNNQEQKKLEEVMRIENKKLQINSNCENNVELKDLNKSNQTNEMDSTLSDIIGHDDNPMTITDTKNIPIINEAKAKVRSRLVTSLDAVIKPVPKLIIRVNNDSDDSECEEPVMRKTFKKASKRTASGFEKREIKNTEFETKLDNFLKNIRQQQEILSVNVANQPLTPASSAVKHLPPSSQKEYEKLIEKMRFLEDEKRKRMRQLNARQQLKRSKTNSTSQTQNNKTPITTETSTVNSTVVINKVTPEIRKASQKEPVIAPKQQKETSADKISNTLKKISLLDQEAQQRLMIKTESNFRMHSESLCQAASDSVKILESNANDLKRQEKLVVGIAELEKQLKRYKANLNVLNKKIRGSVGKFIQSQREMIQTRIRQKSFEQRVCIPFGKMLKGPDYRAPEMTEETEKLNGNYRLILEQVEELDDNEIFASDPAVKNSFKVISDRLKRFLPVENSEDKVQDETINENSNSSSSESKNSTMNCSEAIVTNGEDPKSTDAEVDSSQHPTEQPVNNNIESIDIRITSYESPLEMMRTNKTKVASVDKVLCPYQLEGMCDDKKCTYVHF